MNYGKKRQVLPKSPFRMALDQQLKHWQALELNLKLKEINWSTALICPPTPEGMEKLQKRRDIIQANYDKLHSYIERHESAENPARRDMAIFMARQYQRYLNQIDDAMDNIVAHIARVQGTAWQLANDIREPKGESNE